MFGSSQNNNNTAGEGFGFGSGSQASAGGSTSISVTPVKSSNGSNGFAFGGSGNTTAGSLQSTPSNTIFTTSSSSNNQTTPNNQGQGVSFNSAGPGPGPGPGPAIVAPQPPMSSQGFDASNFPMEKIENAAQSMYTTGGDPSSQALIQEWQNSPNCIHMCVHVIKASQVALAQVFAVQLLSDRLSKSFTTLELQDRYYLLGFLMDYLYNQPDIPAFVVPHITNCLGLMVKLGWFDKNSSGDFLFRDQPVKLKEFLKGTNQVRFIRGLRAMTDLIGQVDEQGSIRSFTLQRKICTSFRDNALLELLKTALEVLDSALYKKDSPFATEQVVHQSINMVLKCLQFDFIGTCPEDSGEDNYSVELPSVWKETINSKALKLFIEIYRASNPPHSSKVLECIVQLGSIRRTFFPKEERKSFFTLLLSLVLAVFTGKIVITHSNDVHQFIRLIVRMKVHEIGSIMDSSDYSSFMDNLAEYTLNTLMRFHLPEGDIDYLLLLWAQLATNSSSRNRASSIEISAPKIVKIYLESRLQRVGMALEGKAEDLLDSQEQLMDQLEKVSIISRCQYSEVYNFINNQFDTVAVNYQNLLINSPDSKALTAYERKLAWLTYTISVIIGTRTGNIHVSNNDGLDEQLTCKILTLMKLTDLHHERSCIPLEHAYLIFFKSFSKTYIGTHVLRSSRIFTLLAEHLQLPDQLAVLDLFIGKIIGNLKRYSSEESIIKETLNTLSELSMGYSYVRMLTKLDNVKQLLCTHNKTGIAFMTVPKFLKYRTVYYNSLSRLLFVCHDVGMSEIFDKFMQPFDETFQGLSNLFSSNDQLSIKNNNQAMVATISMARDLRGILLAAQNKEMYMLVFNHIFPKYSTILHQACKIWASEVSVTTPILKFFNEFADNKKKRIEFEISSANGYVLFRAFSDLIHDYATTMLSQPLSHNVEKQRYYACRHSLQILMFCLSGKYVNFGVFKLYGDNSLEKALNVFLYIISAVPLKEILNFPKLKRVYYELIQNIVDDHMYFFATLNKQAFYYIMSSLNEGLNNNSSGPDNDIAVRCCASIDRIVSYHIKATHLQANVKSTNTPSIGHMLQESEDLLKNMLNVMFQAIMFEDCTIYWSLSRPMFSLILYNKSFFNDVKNSIIAVQSKDRQVQFEEKFGKLMEDISDQLTQINRNQFTKNMNLFRRDITNFTKTAPDPNNSVNGMAAGNGNEGNMMMY